MIKKINIMDNKSLEILEESIFNNCVLMLEGINKEIFDVLKDNLEVLIQDELLESSKQIEKIFDKIWISTTSSTNMIGPYFMSTNFV